MDNRNKLQQILNEISDSALGYLFPGFRRRSDKENIIKRIKPLRQVCKIKTSEEKLVDGLNYFAAEEVNYSLGLIAQPIEQRLQLKRSKAYDAELQEEAELERRYSIIIAEIEALQKRYDITIEELQQLLSYKVELSHLRVTRDWGIILDDFDAREVKMDKLSKSIFFLYLKHPEGIRFKELCDYKSELEKIYMSVSGRTDINAMRKSIDDLTDSTMSNSINEKVSKVKKAFRNVVDDRIAKYYYIDGKQGEIKTIALDRSLVLWE